MAKLRTSWSIEYDSEEIYLHIASENVDSLRIIIPFDNIKQLKEFKNIVNETVDDVIQYILNYLDNESLSEDL